MQNGPSKGTVLYFEDDQSLSDIVMDYLSDEGYQVTHFNQYPDAGIQAIQDRMIHPPEIVLMDIGMPGLDGYQICKKLKQDYLEPMVPILFISGKVSEQNILDAYDAGADDYLTKPLRIKQLGIKLQQYAEARQKRIIQQNQMSGAQKMAFEAMTTSAELGEILRFHEESYLTSNLDELASLILKSVAKFSLKASISFFTHKTTFYRDDGQHKPLEEKTLLAFKDQQRVFSWKNRTFFNYKYFSVLIRNMPIDDQDRYGILKDQLCLLFNGVDARVKALTMERSNELKAQTMKAAADTIANMVMEIEQDNVELSQEFEQIILKMETEISSDFIQFNLLEHEEQRITSHVMNAIKESSDLFEASMEKEKQYKDIMTRLLKELLGTD